MTFRLLPVVLLALAAAALVACEAEAPDRRPGGADGGELVETDGVHGEPSVDVRSETVDIADSVAPNGDGNPEPVPDGLADAVPELVPELVPEVVPETVPETAAETDAEVDAGDAPVAVIGVDEGDEVFPQTVLHLRSDGSSSPAGAIVAWEWSVEQPAGSTSLFAPSATVPDPTFEVNVAGTYTFRLRVWDAAGKASPTPGEVVVYVCPCNQALHVELLWSTPGDDDPFDEGPTAGSDLDLHLAHPDAAAADTDGDGLPDPWFDTHWDCFWFNAHPDWGVSDPAVDDDPSLDRDDTDGAGPENLNLAAPPGTVEAPRTYRIGVHAWNDHGFGPSLATVRVYLVGSLVFEAANVELAEHDLWEVATFEWPGGKVEMLQAPDGGPLVKPAYQPEAFYTP